jgi:hypothetical protein
MTERPKAPSTAMIPNELAAESEWAIIDFVELIGMA